MPRPREFDPDEVLERALRQFWDTGYEATSVQDLVDATGLNRSSLYASFGCKNALYLAVLDRYRQRQVRRLSRRLENVGASPLGQIRAVFEEAADACEEGRGCFLVDAAVERARHSEPASERAAAGLRDVEDAFVGAVRLAQRAGEVPDALAPDAAARFLANAYRGLHVTARLHPERDALRNVIDATMAGLQSVPSTEAAQ